mgnify:CR=1 FL=1
MKFQFLNIMDLILMNGHGYYVWTAVVVTFFTLMCLIVNPLIKRKKVINLIARDIDREVLRPVNHGDKF